MSPLRSDHPPRCPPALRSFLDDALPYALVEGDALAVLRACPDHVVDACLTSPPYWAQRRYAGGGLGNEADPETYVTRLVEICREVRRVLKPGGSLWLNLGDTYRKKSLVGIPWRAALALQADGWLLRNDVIWDKVKGNPCNARDKLRNVHEHVFHLVARQAYFYDVDAIRTRPGIPTYRDGPDVTPTGVNGAKYERQIRRSAALTEAEKANALAALRDALRHVAAGELPDFRMVIRGTQRFTHSDAPDLSGRAQELHRRGFCILPYHKNGAKPGDVWQITPEDEWRTDGHYAVFPLALCELPIKATVPVGGVLLDPFAGTGTSLVAALQLGRRGLGIDISPVYLDHAARRLARLLDAIAATPSPQPPSP